MQCECELCCRSKPWPSCGKAWSQFDGDECSRLRSECRRLSSEVVARDSEVLARVLRQLNDMRSLLDQGALEEVAALPERAREAASRAAGKAAGRGQAAAGRGAGRSGRVSPARERNQDCSDESASARQLTRGLTKGLKRSRGKASPLLVVAMAADLDSTMAANSALRDENEALASLMEEVHSLAEQWQEVCARAKSHGKEAVAAELKELRCRWEPESGKLAFWQLPELRAQREILQKRLKALEQGARSAPEKPIDDAKPEQTARQAELETAKEESEVLRSQNRELKEAIAQARSAIRRRLDRHSAENTALVIDNEDLGGLVEEVQNLAGRWQKAWARAAETVEGERKPSIDAEIEELRSIRNHVRDRLLLLEPSPGRMMPGCALTSPATSRSPSLSSPMAELVSS
eukprot:s3016_g6.t1